MVVWTFREDAVQACPRPRCFLCLLIALALMSVQFLPALGEETDFEPLPPWFRVSVTREGRAVGDQEKYVTVESVTTVNPRVNAELAALVSGLEAKYLGRIPADERKLAWRNNRLDVEVTWSRTGESLLSALVCARQTVRREQTACPFITRTYDLLTGQRFYLSDLFPKDSPAWELLAARTREHLLAVFPGEPRSTAAVEAYSAPQAMRKAQFTLGGMELTLHYEARTFLPGKTGLIHVRFYYPEFEGMMTEEGVRQTDNSRYRLVALTADDGPEYELSVKSINAFRQSGARVTFFTSGSLYEDGVSVLQREFDGNHIVASHSFRHQTGNAWSIPARLRQLERSNAILLAHLGEPARLFRAPGGVYVPWIEAQIGLPIIQWSVDSYDYKGRTARQIFRNVTKYVRDGDIVLMHDVSPHLFEAAPLICEYLDDHGFLTVSVEELAWANGITLSPGVVYHQLRDGVFSERRDSNVN